MSTLRLYEAETSPERIAAKYHLAPGDIIDFSLNVNPFGPPAGAAAAARRSLERCNEYPDLTYARLRRRLAERHAVPAEHFLFGGGLDDVIKLLVHAWTSAGDRVLIHIPTFPRYELEAAGRGAVTVLVRSDPPWRIDVDSIRRALLDSPIRLAFLCTPNNPTGEVIPNSLIAALAGDFPQTLFVVDEALIDPAEDGAVPLVLRHANLCVLRTFSKYFGLAGLRVGYALGPPPLVREFELLRPPFNLSTPAAAAAEAAVGDDAFLERTRQIFSAEMQFFKSSVRGEVLGSRSNMLLLGLKGIGSAAFCEALARRGILVADGRSFHGLEAHDTVRISLRDRAANERLVAAIQAVS